MTIVLIADKLTELTAAEADENIRDLRDGDSRFTPKTKGTGLKVDQADPDWGWYDLLGELHVYGDIGDANRIVYRGGIKSLQFALSDSAYVDFHMPHDYAMGTDLFIHVHWSHNSTLVTGGSTTWGFEIICARGHDQQPFTAPVTASVIQNASTTQYQHMIAETIASVSGGSGVAMDTDGLEVDALILCRVYLDSNDIIVSGGGVPEPFAHFVDIHYQSTGVPTKQKEPDFWT